MRKTHQHQVWSFVKSYEHCSSDHISQDFLGGSLGMWVSLWPRYKKSQRGEHDWEPEQQLDIRLKWLHLMPKKYSFWAWQGTCSRAWTTGNADHLEVAREVYGSCQNLCVSIAIEVSLQREKRREFRAI